MVHTIEFVADVWADREGSNRRPGEAADLTFEDGTMHRGTPFALFAFTD